MDTPVDTTQAQPRIAAETIALIETMAGNNRLWGAERIRGKLLKLGIRVVLEDRTH